MFIRARDVHVHYVEHGADPAAPTLVLLHGFGPDHRLMTGCFEPVLAGRPGIRRIYVDLPGMGRTHAPETVRGTDDVFAVVREAIDHIVGGGTYMLVGESYGGYLARGLVAASPERIDGLMLLCPLIDPHNRDVPPRRVLVREPALTELVGSGVLDADDMGVVQTTRTWTQTQDDIASGLAIADKSVLDRLSGAYAGTFAVEAQSFGKPSLILTGRQDSVAGYTDAGRILEHYPRATYAVIDRAGHNLQIEQPALFAALVSEWLDRVGEAR